MLGWLKDFNRHFIDDCRLWYKKWSSWLAFLWGLIGVVFWNIPTWLPQLVTNLPPEVRALLSPLVLLLLSGLPILVANLKQKKLEDAVKQLQEKKQ
jgi:hypothetical protein